MQAIVSALDQPWRERVEEIWGEVKAVFGVKQVVGAMQPHFMYHGAERYAATAIDQALGRIAGAAAPFEIETHGLGVFRGPQTVLYLHVTPGDALLRMHRRIWDDVTPLASDVKQVYAAETWVPHITLATGNVPDDQLPEIMAFLGTGEYRWRVPVTNICLVPDTTSAVAAWTRFELAGSS